MSTIFGHGRLRLYLLKLLDESPRHGYEIISLLRDRFLGVYSPSPGTIYPRLARLEEEGLVTHTEKGGRKVYSLTDKGREELRARESDLDDLEREITDSVRDIARAVKQDVRETISSLRDELKFASGEGRRESSGGEDRKKSDDKDRDCGDNGMWAREWERFAQGFGAFGAAWGGRGESEGSERSDSDGAKPGTQDRAEFEHALRDFSVKVRDMVRGAGQVGESASNDLRRILDETVEVIRRDMGRWGPPDRDEGTASSDGPGTAERPEPEPESKPEPETPDARPMPPSGGDPWSTATGEDDQKKD
ncbi:PadR family transcriptional regulator [Nocardiopsis sp. B62]|uniref:PadR family transcriptional regulator n=1 Tax=Nocardiopsis sp. B62 TaxID=2824874 RepID=UPI001B39866C|nr:PadR family transcriptional regulator [Nocardiopsis sp. B62]MBQ1083691.1 PadR family transcriptional regulator [Nocardiopsis sp. B62]